MHYFTYLLRVESNLLHHLRYFTFQHRLNKQIKHTQTKEVQSLDHQTDPVYFSV